MAKEWAWSYSRKKNFDTCPKRHHEVDVLKNYVEVSEQLTWGNAVHKALADACTGKAPLPATMKSYQARVDEIASPSLPGRVVVEQKYAITRDFKPTSYFAPDVWYRGICDVARINGPVAIARDWKTGKVKHDSIQLMLMATCLFVHIPELRRIKTEFVWLQEDCVTPELWDRRTIMQQWTAILPEIVAMEQAYKTLSFPPKPGKLCRRWCPVTSCPYNGKGA